MRLILGVAAAAMLAGCATYDGYGPDGYGRDRYERDGDRAYGRYRYEGSEWGGRRRGGSLRGRGVERLDPWLAETPEGAAIVRSGWRSARRGRVDGHVAERANVWFRRYADADRDLCLTDAEIRWALVQAARHIRSARR